MPASNMAATAAANPSTGKAVLMSPFSGPKGSPLDKDNSTTTSTGALNTGIGMGLNAVISAPAVPNVKNAGFFADEVPGLSMPGGTAAPDARLTAIGGGRSGPCAGGVAPTNPYEAQPLLAFGAGVSRDAGAGPAFTGFPLKMVTATGAVAIGAAIVAGFTNRSPQAMVSGESAFGSSVAASAAVA